MATDSSLLANAWVTLGRTGTEQPLETEMSPAPRQLLLPRQCQPPRRPRLPRPRLQVDSSFPPTRNAEVTRATPVRDQLSVAAAPGMVIAARVQATAELVATQTSALVPLPRVTSTTLPTGSADPKSKLRAANMETRRAALSMDTAAIARPIVEPDARRDLEPALEEKKSASGGSCLPVNSAVLGVNAGVTKTGEACGVR